MTINENARFTVYQYVQSYVDRICNDYWGTIKAIKTALKIQAITTGEAEMLCNNMHITFEEMMTA